MLLTIETTGKQPFELIFNKYLQKNSQLGLVEMSSVVEDSYHIDLTRVCGAVSPIFSDWKVVEQTETTITWDVPFKAMKTPYGIIAKQIMDDNVPMKLSAKWVGNSDVLAKLITIPG